MQSWKSYSSFVQAAMNLAAGEKSTELVVLEGTFPHHYDFNNWLVNDLLPTAIVGYCNSKGKGTYR